MSQSTDYFLNVSPLPSRTSTVVIQVQKLSVPLSSVTSTKKKLTQYFDFPAAFYLQGEGICGKINNSIILLHAVMQDKDDNFEKWADLATDSEAEEAQKNSFFDTLNW